jgi:hypothetical protein
MLTAFAFERVRADGVLTNAAGRLAEDALLLKLSYWWG